MSMMPNLQSLTASNLATIGSVASAILAGLFALMKYLGELRKDRALRAQSMEQAANRLRWDQARLGHEMLNEMLTDVECVSATDLLDMEAGDHEIEVCRTNYTCNETDIIEALKIPDGDAPKRGFRAAKVEFSEKKLEAIRRAFDALFFYISRLEHYISIGLVRFEDVEYPASYYVRCIATTKAMVVAVRQYVVYYRLGKTLQFLERFQSWRATSRLHSTLEKIVKRDDL